MRILVAIDGSEPALRALRFAIDLLHRLPEPRSIGLVCVHDDSALRGASHVVGRKLIEDYLAELTERDLGPAAEMLRQTELAFELIRRTGRPEQEIVAAAQDGAFDLIAMGSKGRSGIADLLVGSVAQRVSALAEQPVVLVK